MKDYTLGLIIFIIIVAFALFYGLPAVLMLLSALVKNLWTTGIEIWQALFQMW